MPSRAGFKVAFSLSGKKVLSARSGLFFLAGFLSLLGYLWVADSFSLSFRAFLWLFPYLFLFASQDMMREEIDSGMLENVLFLEGRFRRYLMLKNFVIVTLAAVLSGALFLFFALGTLATSVFPSQAFARFLSGLLAGTYYVALAGFLGLFFRAGSNVLLIVLGQGCLLAGLLLSAGHKGAWIDRLAASSFPGLAAKLEFFATAAVFPNLLAGQRPGWPFLGLAVLALVGFGMQWAFLLRLELGRK